MARRETKVVVCMVSEWVIRLVVYGEDVLGLTNDWVGGDGGNWGAWRSRGTYRPASSVRNPPRRPKEEEGSVVQIVIGAKLAIPIHSIPKSSRSLL